MLHYISISKFLREIMASYLSFNSLKARVISLNSLLQWRSFGNVPIRTRIGCGGHVC